jgi:hypothetical protein
MKELLSKKLEKLQESEAKKKARIAFRFHEGSGINDEYGSIVWETYKLVKTAKIALKDGKRQIRGDDKSADGDKSYSSGVSAPTTKETTLPGHLTFTGKPKPGIWQGLFRSRFAKDFDGTSFPKISNLEWDRDVRGMALGYGREENAYAAVTTITDMQDHHDIFLMTSTEEPTDENVKKYENSAPLIIKNKDSIWVYWRDLEGNMKLARPQNPKLYASLNFPDTENKPVGPTTILSEMYKNHHEEEKEEKTQWKRVKTDSKNFYENLEEGVLYINWLDDGAVIYSGSGDQVKDFIKLDPTEYQRLKWVFDNKNKSHSQDIISVYKNARTRQAAEAAAKPIYEDLAETLGSATPKSYNKAVLMGWSRGAITCIHDANMMWETGFREPIHLFLIDPVAGNGVGDVEEMIRKLPPNARVRILLTKGDRTKEFEPQDRSRILELENGAKVEFIVVNGTHSQVAGCPKESKDNPECAPAKITWYYVDQWLTEALGEDREKFIDENGLKKFMPEAGEMMELFAKTEVEFKKHHYIIDLAKNYKDAIYTVKLRDFAQDIHSYVKKPEFFVNDTHEKLFEEKYNTLYKKYIDNPDPSSLNSIEELDEIKEPYSKKLLIAGILLREVDQRIRDLYKKEQECAKNPLQHKQQAAFKALKLALMELREAAALSIFDQLEKGLSKESTPVARDSVVQESTSGRSASGSNSAVSETKSGDGNAPEYYPEEDEVLCKSEDEEESKEEKDDKQETSRKISITTEPVSQGIAQLQKLPLVETCQEAVGLVDHVRSPDNTQTWREKWRQMTNRALVVPSSDSHKVAVQKFSKKNIGNTRHEGLIKRFCKAILHAILTCAAGPLVGYSAANWVCGFFRNDVVKHQEKVASAAARVSAIDNGLKNP